jgi:hypothetical protein
LSPVLNSPRDTHHCINGYYKTLKRAGLLPSFIFSLFLSLFLGLLLARSLLGFSRALLTHHDEIVHKGVGHPDGFDKLGKQLILSHGHHTVCITGSFNLTPELALILLSLLQRVNQVVHVEKPISTDLGKIHFLI